MIIHAVDSLLEIHKKVGQLNDIWKVACKRRRYWILGPKNWEDVKYKTKEVDAKVILFDIPLSCAPRQFLRIWGIGFEVVAPYIYDRFIGFWGQFLHLDQVSL